MTPPKHDLEIWLALKKVVGVLSHDPEKIRTEVARVLDGTCADGDTLRAADELFSKGKFVYDEHSHVLSLVSHLETQLHCQVARAFCRLVLFEMHKQDKDVCIDPT